MDKNKNKKTVFSPLREEIDQGISNSRDPENSNLPALAARITTMYSPWYTRTCPECKHKFREGDRVRLCPNCERAYHDDDQYHLHCWQQHFSGPEKACTKGGVDRFTRQMEPGCDFNWQGHFPDELKNAAGENEITASRIPEVTSDFLKGVQTIWKPFGDEKVIEVAEDDYIVGHNCPWCRFKIRAGDRVVKCPCGNCETYFHNDLYRHLECWNEWNCIEGKHYCPTTGERYKTQFTLKNES